MTRFIHVNASVSTAYPLSRLAILGQIDSETTADSGGQLEEHARAQILVRGGLV
jgi:hypothetical protein